MSIPELEGRARERRWPDGLLARVIAVNTPRWVIEKWLAGSAADEVLLADIERQVGIFEKLADGTLRAREITPHDEAGFTALWALAPEWIGDWEVTVERGPDALAQFMLHEDPGVNIIEDCGEVVASMAWSSANVVIGGVPTSIHYAMGLRVAASRRREGLGDVVRRFPRRSLARPSVGQIMFVRLGNENVDQFLNNVGFGAGAVRPRSLVSVTHLAAAPLEWPAGARKARPEDFDACAALINRTHAGLDLFHPLGEEGLSQRLNRGAWGATPAWSPVVYGPEDFFVLERRGRIVACAGLWDRGRDVRELWRHKVRDESMTVSSTVVLDFGCEAERDQELALLVRGLIGKTSELGRTCLCIHSETHPALVEALSDLTQREEPRILEWSPYTLDLKAELGSVSLDLRYW
ncbi:MAG: hypothetical protein U1E24_04115 [Phenylobacterium sp.]|nr:hypothetical protein [Phenylobacterium sp.]